MRQAGVKGCIAIRQVQSIRLDQFSMGDCMPGSTQIGAVPIQSVQAASRAISQNGSGTAARFEDTGRLIQTCFFV